MLCYSITVRCSCCRCHRGQLSFLFHFILFFFKTMGNVGVFPWRVGKRMVGGFKSKKRGRSSLPFPPLPSLVVGTKTSQGKKEEQGRC